MSRRLTACAVLATTLSLAACGTTVPLTSQGISGAPSSLGTSGTGAYPGQAPAAVPGGGTAVGAQVPGSGPVAGGTAPGPGQAQGGGPVGTTGATANGGPVITGRGVSAKTLTIGAAFATGTEAVGAAFGISGGSAVAEQDVWNAVVADVNRTGGVLGRTLALYTHPVDLGSYVANPEQTYAEVCSDFRDDHKVFAAFISISAPALRRCMGRMGTPLVVYGANVSSIVPAAAFTEYGGNYLYAPGGTTSERLAQLYVDSLVARSFHAKWDTANGRPGVAPLKLGLIHADTPDQNLLYAAYTRELRKHGLTFSDTVTYSGDASTALAATQGAVLKFASEGITHVYGASAFFLRYAESQHYRPRYAFLPGLGAFGAANSPPEQLAGAMTVGWAPTQDVNETEDPGPIAGAARCLAVMKAAGLPKGSRQDHKLMYGVCDAVYGFREAMNTGRSPSVAGLRRGFEGLGRRFAPALTFTSTLSPQRHYGVDAMRDMAFDSACSCLKYTSRTDRS